ncbi:hypothetical protein Tco_0397368 [Tanacetum coccineum]
MNRHSSKRSNTKGYHKSSTSSSNNYKKKAVVGGAGSYSGSPALSSNSYKKNNAAFGGFGSSRGYVSSKSISSAGGSGVATKLGQVPVNAAKQSSPRAATSIRTARPVNTAAPKPKVNDALPTTYSYFLRELIFHNIDNESEFKNNDINQFRGMKGIKGRLVWPELPQQMVVAEKNDIYHLIEALGLC